MAHLVIYGAQNLQNEEHVVENTTSHIAPENLVDMQELAREAGGVVVSVKPGAKVITLEGTLGVSSNLEGVKTLLDLIASYDRYCNKQDRYLRIMRNYTVIENFESVGNWTAAKEASNLTLDNEEYQMGDGCLNFDIDGASSIILNGTFEDGVSDTNIIQNGSFEDYAEGGDIDDFDDWTESAGSSQVNALTGNPKYGDYRVSLNGNGGDDAFLHQNVTLAANTRYYFQYGSNYYSEVQITYTDGSTYYLQDDLETWSTTPNDISAFSQATGSSTLVVKFDVFTTPSFAGTYNVKIINYDSAASGCSLDGVWLRLAAGPSGQTPDIDSAFECWYINSDGWDMGTDPESYQHITVEDSVVHSGSRAVKLYGEGTKIAQDVTLEASEDYILKWFHYGTGYERLEVFYESGASTYYLQDDGSWSTTQNDVAIGTPGTDWTEEQLEITTPAFAGTYTFSWEQGNGGSVIYLDYVRLYKTDLGSVISNSSMTSVDLSSVSEEGGFGFWIYIPDAIYTSTIEFRIGNDSSNYYEGEVSAQFDDEDFESGWNFVAFEWADMTETGTVIDSALDYAYIRINYEESQESDTDYRVDGLMWMDEGETRNYRCYKTRYDKRDEHHDVTETPITLEFLAYKAVAHGTFEELVFDSDAVRNETQVVELGGSYEPAPKFTIEISDSTGLDKIRVTNQVTGQYIEVDESWSNDDTVIIDCLAKAVTHNGDNIEPTGIFPTFNIGTNRVAVSLTTSALDTQSQTTQNAWEYTIPASGNKFVIAQSFVAGADGIIETCEGYFKPGSGAPGNHFGFYLCYDNGGKPGYTYARYSADVPGSESWVTLPSATDSELLGDIVNTETYWLVCTTNWNKTPWPIYNYYCGKNTAGGYGSGSLYYAEVSSGTGIHSISTWAERVGQDMAFKVYITDPDSGEINWQMDLRKRYL